LVVLVLAGSAIAALVANARSDDADLARRQRVLDRYTSDVRARLQTLRNPAGDMAGAPTEPDAPALDELTQEARRWSSSIAAVQVQFSQLPPAEGLETVNGLFGQAAQLYAGAAETYTLPSSADDPALVKKLLARAAAQRDQATALWQAAVGLLDGERRDAELGPSGLTPPAATPQAPPATNGGGGGGGGDGQGEPGGEGGGGGN
jgi:hypothetical protein